MSASKPWQPRRRALACKHKRPCECLPQARDAVAESLHQSGKLLRKLMHLVSDTGDPAFHKDRMARLIKVERAILDLTIEVDNYDYVASAPRLRLVAS